MYFNKYQDEASVYNNLPWLGYFVTETAKQYDTCQLVLSHFLLGVFIPKSFKRD